MRALMVCLITASMIGCTQQTLSPEAVEVIGALTVTADVTISEGTEITTENGRYIVTDGFIVPLHDVNEDYEAIP